MPAMEVESHHLADKEYEEAFNYYAERSLEQRLHQLGLTKAAPIDRVVNRAPWYNGNGNCQFELSGK